MVCPFQQSSSRLPSNAGLVNLAGLPTGTFAEPFLVTDDIIIHAYLGLPLAVHFGIDQPHGQINLLYPTYEIIEAQVCGGKADTADEVIQASVELFLIYLMRDD